MTTLADQLIKQLEDQGIPTIEPPKPTMGFGKLKGEAHAN